MKFKKTISAFLAALIILFAFSACSGSDFAGGDIDNADESQPATQTELETENGEKLVVHYLDVGQGDCEFIEFPNGQTMLIDAGEKENGNMICEKIKALGYTKLDYVVATHPHADHIGGLPAVFEQFEIETVYMPNGVSTSKTYEKLLDAIEAEDCAVVRAINGVSVIDDGLLKAYFVAPVSEEYDNLNNYSAVLMVKYGTNSFLFMGDAENESEAEITADVKADVLKVGHHGSKTASSEAFIKNVNPKYAIIEVGKDNSYGHPHNESINRLRSLGTEIITTSEHGDITASSNGKIIDIVKER